jgi:hypothetical protein
MAPGAGEDDSCHGETANGAYLPSLDVIQARAVSVLALASPKDRRESMQTIAGIEVAIHCRIERRDAEFIENSTLS